MRRRDTQQRKQALAGLKRTAGMDWMLGTLVRVIHSGKQALDAVMLEMGRMVAESVRLMEREEIAGPEYYPTDPAFQKWAHEAGSIYLGDQKVPVTRPRLRHIEQGWSPSSPMPAYAIPGRSRKNYWRRFFGVSRLRSMPTPFSMRHTPWACLLPQFRRSWWS
jgi:hypothetical protein